MNNINFSFRNFIIVFLILFSVNIITAQVGVNTISPGATLDITGQPTDTAVLDGIIAPRITGDQLRAKTYTAAQTAAVIYVTAADSSPAGQTIDVTQVGYFFFNGSKWVALTAEEDDDFYEVGTTVAAQAITDDIYRTGKMAIGKTTASYPLDIDNTSSSRTLNVKLSGSTDASTHSLYVANENTSDNIHYGVYSLLQNNTGTGNRYGMYTNVQIPGSQTNQAFGIYNNLTASTGGNGAQTGTMNRLGANVYRAKTGVTNYITGTDNGQHIGVSSNLSGTGTGNHFGVQNIVRGTGILKGVYNTFNNASGDNSNIGMETQNTNDGDGVHKGVHTRLDGDGTGEKIGNTNYITSENGAHTGTNNVLKRDGSQTGTTGTGVKIGVYNNITDSEGDNYGVYNYLTQTVTGKTSYGSYNHVESDNGTNIGGYFTANGAGTNYSAIFDDGNVGIGTSTPASTNKLEVNGRVQAANFKVSALSTDIPTGRNSLGTGTLGEIRITDAYIYICISESSNPKWKRVEYDSTNW